jgi:hypothetical protein
VRRVRQLRKLRTTLNRRLSRLERRLASLTSTSTQQDRDMTVAYVAIEALNAWALFSRSFYLSCAIGAKTEQGKYIKINTAITDPLGLAITTFRRLARPNTAGVWHRRDEPSWHDPNVLMNACAALGCSIQAEISASFSLQQNVFNDLPFYEISLHIEMKEPHRPRDILRPATLCRPRCHLLSYYWRSVRERLPQSCLHGLTK